MHARQGARCRFFIALPLLLLGLLALGAQAERQRIFLDGDRTEWDALAALYVDASGDGGTSGIDLGAVWVAEDETHVFLRLEIGSEQILQDENQLSLYFDGDNDPATGYVLGPLGAELRWDFGERAGFFFFDGDWVDVTWADLDFVALPSYASVDYEMMFARDARPDGTHLLFSADTLRFMVHDWAGGGDWLPEAGTALTYVFDQGSLDPLETVGLESASPGGVRLLSYNVHFDDLFDAWRQPAYERILQAIDPDVIAFQEIYDHSAAQTRSLIEGFLGGDWEALQVSDKVLLTRGTIEAHWSIAEGRAGAFRLSPLGAFAEDLLVIDAHLSCCGADAARQEQADAIMAFVRDARTPGGQLDLDPASPIVITGDMNFVGLSGQRTTLLTGDIADEATYGPDFAPDWDETDLLDRLARHPTCALGYTWVNEGSDYWPGRLDYIILSDSNTRAELELALQTDLLPPDYLTAHGLQAGDTDDASDHLPVFADLVPADAGAVTEPPLAAAGVRLMLRGPHPGRDAVRFAVQFAEGMRGVNGGRGALLVRDVAGRCLTRMAFATPAGGTLRGVWDGRDAAGRRLPAGSYWLQLIAGEPIGAPVRVVLVR